MKKSFIMILKILGVPKAFHFPLLDTNFNEGKDTFDENQGTKERSFLTTDTGLPPKKNCTERVLVLLAIKVGKLIFRS